MKEKIYIYDENKNTFIEFDSLVQKMDELRQKQLQKFSEKLLSENKLKGPLVEFKGHNVWKVQIKNDQNYYEQHLLRLGEDTTPEKLPSFTDTYTGMKDLFELKIKVWEDLPASEHQFNPREQEYYNTTIAWSLDTYFENEKFSDSERKEIFDILNGAFLGKKSDRIKTFSDIRHTIETTLASGREVKMKIKVG